MTTQPTRGAQVRRRSPLWGLLLLVVLAVTLAGIFPFRQIIAEQRDVQAAADQLAALEAETDRLESEVRLLHTDAEIERIARERFGLVRPGEVGYVVTWKAVDAPEREVIEVPKDERAWYRKFWDFVTGTEYQLNG